MATTVTTVTDPYNVGLSIYRNREWIQYFTVSEQGSPLDISQDELALIVLSGPDLVLSNTTPLVSSGSGSCSFVYADTDTESLTANARYIWQFLRRPKGAINSDLLTAGPLNVGESPVFP
jgi:hypothetical protein